MRPLVAATVAVAVGSWLSAGSSAAAGAVLGEELEAEVTGRMMKEYTDGHPSHAEAAQRKVDKLVDTLYDKGLVTCDEPFLVGETRLGYLASVVEALERAVGDLRTEWERAAVGGAFGQIEDSDFKFASWDHIYLYAIEEDFLTGWNTSACTLLPGLCKLLGSGNISRFLEGPLQKVDDQPGYAALYRTQAGGYLQKHRGGFRANVHVVISTPPGVYLEVARERHMYREGEVMVWNDDCEHKVVHPAKSQGSRVVLAIKMPHPVLVDHSLSLRPKQRRRKKPKSKTGEL